MDKLNGKVALVTGASRGAGKGIAIALGEWGAKVYVTARSTRDGFRTEMRKETLEDTAEEVTSRGGRGIPIVCDHRYEEQTKKVIERIESEDGKLDLLVNSVWGGYEGFEGAGWKDGTAWEDFWIQSLKRWDGTFNAGVKAYLTAGMLAAPLMIKKKKGLIVHITDGISPQYRGNIFWDLSHECINRMAYAMAMELQTYKVASLAITPGWIRTERVMESIGKKETKKTESVLYIGRVIRALTLDDNYMKKSGKKFTVHDLAVEYGVKDIDGTQPDFWGKSKEK